MRSLIIIIILAMLGLSPAWAQMTPKQIKKQVKLAEKQLEAGNVYDAADLYEEVVDQSTDEAEVALKLGDALFYSRDYKAAVPYYERAARLVSVSHPDAIYKHGLALKMTGEYAKAIKAFEEFRSLKSSRATEWSDMRKWAKIEIEGAELAQALIKNPDDVLVKHLDAPLNSAYSDISPYWLNDSTLLFASLPTDTVIVASEKTDRFIKLYQAPFDDLKPSKPGNFPSITAEGKHVANPSLSPDGNEMFCSICEEDDKNLNQIVCHVYLSKWSEAGWTSPEPLSEAINVSGYSSTHPHMSDQDGRLILYFSSDRPGGKGGKDIWYAQRNRDGSFDDARALSSKINTDRDEATPFYDYDKELLYFSSTGHPGMGGYDIFKAEGVKSGFSEPENLGYPINSEADDMYYRPKGNGQKGVLVSNRPGIISLRSETCCDDIFTFSYKYDIILAVTGLVFDNADSTGDALPDATVSLGLRDEEGNIATLKDDSCGKQGPYYFKIQPNRKYVLTGRHAGYLASTVNLNVPDTKESDTLEVNLYLGKIDYNKAYRLDNIYYDFDSKELREESKTTLDSLYQILVLNPTIKIELSSHTDSRGSDSYNEKLSQGRAQSCVDYLVQERGIDERRIVAKGYGESKQLDDCSKYPECPTGSSGDCPCHQLNRRTEFRVIYEENLSKATNNPAYGTDFQFCSGGAAYTAVCRGF
jgi:outer membrane protein OmpA-like peptidoglycan-associated protein/tetratricopeptide (TPR) repeat protein